MIIFGIINTDATKEPTRKKKYIDRDMNKNIKNLE